MPRSGGLKVCQHSDTHSFQMNLVMSVWALSESASSEGEVVCLRSCLVIRIRLAIISVVSSGGL